MQTSISSTPSVRSFLRRPLSRWQIGFLVVWTFVLPAVYSKAVHAQVEPPTLADVVALDELETPTDDLIRLATAYADAIRELKTASMTVSTLQSLRPAAVITNLEVQIAQVNVQLAESKVRVLRMIVEKQLAAAEAKLEIVKYVEAMGQQAEANGNALAGQSRSRVAQAEATINILKTILEMK